MKKFIKSNIKLIIGVIIGIFLTGSIGVIAYTINAKDVAFTPRNKNWNVSNVEEAIDYLKENTGINLNNINVEYISSYGQQYTSRELNKQLEQEIDAILKEKQKKDSDTHQIKLSIFNLYDKVMKDDGKIEKNDNFDMDADETQLCMKLDKINEKIMDLIKIHKALENQNQMSGSNI